MKKLNENTIPETPKARKLSPFKGSMLRRIRNPSEAQQISEDILKQHLKEVRRRDRTGNLLLNEGIVFLAEEEILDAMKVLSLGNKGQELISEVAGCSDSEYVRAEARKALKG